MIDLLLVDKHKNREVTKNGSTSRDKKKWIKSVGEIEILMMLKVGEQRFVPKENRTLSLSG